MPIPLVVFPEWEAPASVILIWSASQAICEAGMSSIEDEQRKCESCPSYPECAPDQGLLVFCLRGKAPCQGTMRVRV